MAFSAQIKNITKDLLRSSKIATQTRTKRTSLVPLFQFATGFHFLRSPTNIIYSKMPSERLPFEDDLRPVFPGLTGKDLWDTINLVFFSWALLVFLPRWSWTPKLSLLAPLFHAAVYTSGMIMLNLNAPDDLEGDFTTYEGVVRLFQEPNIVFVGWIHYIVFDCLVGRMIVMDSVQLGSGVLFHVLAVIPSLFFTLMAGPMGWLLYMGLRQVFLIPSAAPTKEKLF